jgi:hypothetical protein
MGIIGELLFRYIAGGKMLNAIWREHQKKAIQVSPVPEFNRVA